MEKRLLFIGIPINKEITDIEEAKTRLEAWTRIAENIGKFLPVRYNVVSLRERVSLLSSCECVWFPYGYKKCRYTKVEMRIAILTGMDLLSKNNFKNEKEIKVINDHITTIPGRSSKRIRTS